MRALVTGGAGFIGSNVAKLLVEKGHSVTVLDNLSTGSRRNLGSLPSLDFIEGDVRDATIVAKAMQGVQVVFHLAASVGNSRSIERPIDDSEINVIGTLRVLEAARHVAVRKIVFSSSAAIFGELQYLPIREDHPAEPDSPYGASKLAAEKLCLTYAKLYELEAICLRYFNVYGVNQRYDAYGNVIPIFVYRMLRDLPVTIFGDGEQTRDFVNVRDVAQANYKAALTRGVSGVFNLGSGSATTINHLAELLRRVSGIDFEIEYGPPRAGDVRHSLADISKIRSVLSFSPTVTLSEGLADHVDWWRKDEEARCAC